MPACRTRTFLGKGDERWRDKKAYDTVEEAVSEAIFMETIKPWFHFSAYQCHQCSKFHVGRSDRFKEVIAEPDRFDEAALAERGERALADERRENFSSHDAREAFIRGKGKQAQMRALWGEKSRHNTEGAKALSREKHLEKFLRQAPKRGYTLITSRMKAPRDRPQPAQE